MALVPNRLNRHTFWCGQSGSGKTYALGVLLERVLLTTRLPMVVFDPNSDFVRLGETSPAADAGVSGAALGSGTSWCCAPATRSHRCGCPSPR